MLGLETALPIVQQTMFDTGLLDWAAVARRSAGYQPRTDARLILDSTQSIDTCLSEIARYLDDARKALYRLLAGDDKE